MGYAHDRPPQRSPGVLAELRLLIPHAPVRYVEALEIAEQQANLLLDLISTKGPPVPIVEVISDLPRVNVVYEDSPVIGSTHWDGREWVIVVNRRIRPATRRQTLAHEFKHIIDHTTRGFLYTGMPRLSPIEQAERAAEHFAACLLMPRQHVAAALQAGCRTAGDHALRFAVSPLFATRRLHTLGFAPASSAQMSLLTLDREPYPTARRERTHD